MAQSSAYKRKLSGSTDGKGIKISATATAGTTVHTAVAGTTAGTYDEVWLWAYNGHTADVVVSVECGETELPRTVTIPSKSGPVPLIPGWPYQNGMVIAVFASVTDVIKVDGFVNIITD